MWQQLEQLTASWGERQRHIFRVSAKTIGRAAPFNCHVDYELEKCQSNLERKADSNERQGGGGAEEINLKDNQVGFVLFVFTNAFLCLLFSCCRQMILLPTEVLIWSVISFKTSP